MKNTGKKFISLMLCICMMLGMMQISVFAAPHVHSMVYYDKCEATCVKEGSTCNAWHCTGCDKWFADEAGTVELSESPLLPIDLGNHEVLQYSIYNEYYHEEYCEECGYYDPEFHHEYNYPVITKTAGSADTVETYKVCTCGRVKESDPSYIPPHIIKWNIYTDTAMGAWYVDYVYAARVMGLMTGLTEDTFGPSVTLSRAQFAVILWRMCGSPEMEYTKTFTDVKDGTWYTDAVLWANSKGIVTGYLTGNFGPADAITREQMALMMYRYAKYKKADVTTAVSLASFKDGTKVSSFASNAMRWAVDRGIITGTQNGTMLNPQGKANRAECATIIVRYLAYIKR